MAEDAKSYLNLRLKGRYLIEHHIGSGLSAHAFRAYDTLLQGRVVVKIIKNEIEGFAIDLGEEWKAESRKAMQVRGHPHIASILDLGEEEIHVGNEDETVHFIVTEFVEGRTLREMEKAGEVLEPQDLLTVAHQLLSTLDYLQVRKLSHDDLHSGNIMVSQLGAGRPFIKIIDFGMATNTLVPRNRPKDIHFALAQLDDLCQKTMANQCDALPRSVLEGFAATLKKASSFISTGRMRISDIVSELELLLQELSSHQTSSRRAPVGDEGPRRRIEILRKTPFSGRRNEVERMHQVTQGCFLARRGAVMLVSGEAGIGKTRLVDEVLGRIAADRVRHLLLYRKCTQHESALPLAALFEAIIAFMDDIPGKSDLERLQVLLGQDHHLVKPVLQLISARRSILKGDKSINEDTIDIATVPNLLVSFLLETSLTNPVVMFLDDIHLADLSTVEFLGFLAPRILEAPIVVFATFRPEDLSHVPDQVLETLRSLLGDKGRKDIVRTVELGALDREEIDEILCSLYTFAQPADFTAFSEMVRQMSGGNPFYMFEITGLMQDEGYLVLRGGTHWTLVGDLARFPIPPTIHGLIARRIDRLTLNEILLLRAAALQGQSFDLAVLERMFVPSDEKLPDILDNLATNHQLIRSRGSGNFVFSHHQVHQAILRSMAQEDVQRGHAEVARLLLKIATENENPVPDHLIAHHLALAGQPRKSAKHYLTAGKRALSVQQYHLALDHVRKAADLLTPDDEEDELILDITLSLLEAAKPLGERVLHEQAVRQLQELADKLERPDLMLRAMLEECIYLRTISEHEKSLPIAERLIGLADEAEDLAIQAAALKEAGTTSYLTGKMDKAEGYFHRAAGILASTDDRSQLARVYNNLGLVCRNTQRQEEMVRYFQRALDIFRDVGDTVGERFPLGNLGIVYFERGEFERAYECFTALKASLGNRADLMMEAKVDYSIGEILLEIGLIDEARECCEHALSTFINIGNRQGESEVLGTLGGIHLAMDDIQLAREYFERSIQVKREIGNVVGMLHSQITLARIANREGRHNDALAQAEAVRQDAKKRGLRFIELESLTEIMHARMYLMGPDEALKVLGPDEEPENLDQSSSPALISFSYKAGELALAAGDENRGAQYIRLSGKSVESILERIENPRWREAYKKKREDILEKYRMTKSTS
jgi:predicted ATPase/tRNA A-37 threonylcarbamoyl transferase component Bud32